MYNNKAYIIRTKTNLHVGSGDTNFGIVDNEVQRDSITSLPVINASSLKGSVRDHFSDLLADTNDVNDNTEVKPFVFQSIFGNEEAQGLVKFIDAKLLFLPLRSNKKPYFHVTSKSNLDTIKDFLKTMNIHIELDEINHNNKSMAIGSENDVIIEDVECDSLQIDISKIKSLFNIENLAIFTDEDFNEAVENLPVIARNELTNGNLWYEEIVPRESIFYTVLCYYNNFNENGADRRGKTDKSSFMKANKLFEDKLISDSIQIGANASIGYGICHFSKLGESHE